MSGAQELLKNCYEKFSLKTMQEEELKVTFDDVKEATLSDILEYFNQTRMAFWAIKQAIEQ